MNGQVILDTFNKGKKVPANRHRIPNVGCPEPAERKSPPIRSDQYTWDANGRKHKKTGSPPKVEPSIDKVVDKDKSPRQNLPNIKLPNRLQGRGNVNKS